MGYGITNAGGGGNTAEYEELIADLRSEITTLQNDKYDLQEELASANIYKSYYVNCKSRFDTLVTGVKSLYSYYNHFAYYSKTDSTNTYSIVNYQIPDSSLVTISNSVTGSTVKFSAYCNSSNYAIVCGAGEFYTSVSTATSSPRSTGQLKVGIIKSGETFSFSYSGGTGWIESGFMVGFIIPNLV